MSKASLTAFIRGSKRRLLVLAPTAVLVLLAVGAGFAWRAHAEALLYPTSCLGAWQGSQNAAGTPEALGAPDDAYTEQNSATMHNALAQIFCGNFTGDRPKDSVPTHLTLHMSWAIKLAGPADAPAPITNENFASSTNAIIDAPSDSGATLVIPIPATAAPDVTPEPAPADQTPASAQTPQAEEPAPAPAPSDPMPAASAAFRILSVLGAPQQALAQEISSSTDDSFAEVSYSLDGTTWNAMGKVSFANFRTAAFDIPLEGIQSWDDLQHLQIRVDTLSGLPDNATLYMDGMQLAAEYGPSTDKKSVINDGIIPHISDIDNGGKPLKLTVLHDETGAQQLAVEGSTHELGGLVLFNGESVVLNTNVAGESRYVLSTGSFPVGSYTIVQTTDMGACAATTKSVCLQEPTSTAVNTFSIIPPIEILAPSASSSDATLQKTP